MRRWRMTIACLHSAASNIPLFEPAAARHGLTLRHAVRADLLAEAEAAGGATPAILAETRAELARLAPGARALLLTCSTLGPAVDDPLPLPAWRADAALARQAMARPGRLLVLCAVDTTLEPTRALFAAHAPAGKEWELRLVPGAWARFRAGDTEGYAAAIRAAARGAGTVALAQASMAVANAGGDLLTVPDAAMAAAAQGMPPA
ncbi:Asp/Glu racemase [Rhodovarius crocodyli]|uniref:Asp/Glu racemase n=1 Tax=Rhodovarius crocodyli TaxID=1979269 RepID=A0A437M3V3_9PROT|nr:Asp/Glu racemase [Rhodovarius crocodyli]RVT92322.1 Asp/Glu racemase [Rhodovarius crocodyli]